MTERHSVVHSVVLLVDLKALQRVLRWAAWMVGQKAHPKALQKALPTGWTKGLQTALSRAGHWAGQLAALADLTVPHWEQTMVGNWALQKAL